MTKSDQCDGQDPTSSTATALGLTLCGHTFDGRDFRCEPLPAGVFEDCSFRDCDFRGATLRGLRFAGVDLTGARFDDADLRGATFFDCEASGARWTGARLDSALVVDVHDADDLETSAATPPPAAQVEALPTEDKTRRELVMQLGAVLSDLERATQWTPGELERGQTALTTLSQRCEGWYRPLSTLGRLWRVNKDLDSAAWAFEAALARRPNDLYCVLSAAACQLERGWADEAHRLLSAFDAVHSLTAAERRLFRQHSIEVHIAREQLTLALAETQDQLATAPDDVWFLIKAGELTFRLDRPAESLAMLSSAWKKEPHRQELKLYMAELCLLGLQMPYQALQLLEDYPGELDEHSVELRWEAAKAIAQAEEHDPFRGLVITRSATATEAEEAVAALVFERAGVLGQGGGNPLVEARNELAAGNPSRVRETLDVAWPSLTPEQRLEAVCCLALSEGVPAALARLLADGAEKTSAGAVLAYWLELATGVTRVSGEAGAAALSLASWSTSLERVGQRLWSEVLAQGGFPGFDSHGVVLGGVGLSDGATVLLELSNGAWVELFFDAEQRGRVLQGAKAIAALHEAGMAYSAPSPSSFVDFRVDSLTLSAAVRERSAVTSEVGVPRGPSLDEVSGWEGQDAEPIETVLRAAYEHIIGGSEGHERWQRLKYWLERCCGAAPFERFATESWAGEHFVGVVATHTHSPFATPPLAGRGSALVVETWAATQCLFSRSCRAATGHLFWDEAAAARVQRQRGAEKQERRVLAALLVGAATLGRYRGVSAAVPLFGPAMARIAADVIDGGADIIEAIGRGELDRLLGAQGGRGEGFTADTMRKEP